MHLRKYFEKCQSSQKTILYGDDHEKKFWKNGLYVLWVSEKTSIISKHGPSLKCFNWLCFEHKNIFYKFHCGFRRAKWTLENISKNVSPHKKPFYMVMTTRKSFQKLDFMYLECQKKRQWPQKIAHIRNASTNCVLNTNSILDLGEQNAP